jgi:O-antigen/teichoic acid export membrane protein
MYIVSKLLKTSVIATLIGLIFQISYIRYISYSIDITVYGNYILILTVISFFNLLFFSPLQQSSIRFFHDYVNKSVFFKLFSSYLMTLYVIAFFVVLTLHQLYFKDKFSDLTVYLIMIYFLFFIYFKFLSGIYLHQGKNKKYVYITIMEKTSMFVSPLIFYHFFNSLESLIAGLLVGYMVSFLFVYFNHEIRREKKEFIVDFNKYKKIWIYSYPFIFTSLGSWVVSFSDRWMIDYFLTLKDVGIYAILSQVGGVTLILGSVINTYLLPAAFTEIKNGYGAAIDKWRNALKKSFLLILVVDVVILFIPNELFFLLISPELFLSDNGRTTFLIIFYGISILVLSNIVSVVFMITKNTRKLLVFWLLSAVINLIGNFFIGDYGIIAAALATFSAYTLVFLLSLYYSKRLVYEYGKY